MSLRLSSAGTSAFRVGDGDVVDASVAVVASQREAVVLTSDAADLAVLVEGLGGRARVEALS